MSDIFVRHPVKDYDAWKPGFDEHASTRMEYGATGTHRLYNVSGDPNDLVIVMEWDSAENFQRFMEESDVREKMEELGVTSAPEIHVLDEIESRTAQEPVA